MNEYKIEKTWNYDLFKKLQGNRTVGEKRIGKIMESIQKVGYVISPIIVNQNYEIIDGQGRLEALRRLMLPVYYIKVYGIGFNECVAMNINNTNWSLRDYMESYAQQGNETYQKIIDLADKYHVSFNTVTYALQLKGRFNAPLAKEGGLEYSDEEFEVAEDRLKYLTTFQDIKKINGGMNAFQQAIIYCYSHPDVDKERLKKKIQENYQFMLPWRNNQTAVESIEDIYNRALKPERRVYLGSDFKRFVATYSAEVARNNLKRANESRFRN